MNEIKDYKTPDGFDIKKEGVDYGELTEVEDYSKTAGNTRKCFVYTPAGYDSSITYPIMYLLHGIGGTHAEWLGGSPNEIISNSIACGEARPMIVVIPNIRAAYDDSVPQEVINPDSTAACDNFINDLRDDLMPFIKEHYSVSDVRWQCAVAGLSMGGREALFIGIRMPETFGYIGAFSPAPGLLPMEHPNDRHHEGQLTEGGMTLPDEYKDKTYILMCNGDQEEMFSYISTAYRNAFDNNGVKYEYYVTDGGHDFRVWKNGLYHFVWKIF